MKLNVSKEWCANAAKIEGDSEVGAGCPDTESKEMMRQQRDHLDSLHRQLLQTNNDLQSDNTQLRKEVESACAMLIESQSEVDKIKTDLWDIINRRTKERDKANLSLIQLQATLDRYRVALEKCVVALRSSGAAWKKMADGLDIVKSKGEPSVELGCEVAATFRFHQSGCEQAITAATVERKDVE